jgi:anhydro-N-acetylmuramic acid kinase
MLSSDGARLFRGWWVIVAGVMSGTSADGIDVALVRISDTANTPSVGQRRAPRSGKNPPKTRLRFHLLGHAAFQYPKGVRTAVLAAMNASQASVADLARLNFLLGELYADAVLATQRKFRIKPQLVGCHGQTLFHQGELQRFLGRRVAVTWQTGEAAVIAARVGVPVVSDFRPADMAAGGKGAPLVPFLDYFLYCDAHVGRIAQNIGGIANLTAIPANAKPGQVIAFDTGPGNMVIDAVTERLFHKSYDRDGRIAASGTVLEEVIASILRASFFQRKPPKTAGREEFGREFANDFLRRCGRAPKADIVATATALTACSIADALRKFVVRRSAAYQEIIVSGGGAKNPTLLAMLANQLSPLAISLRLSDEFGLPSVAKEAAAFALLAYETWNHWPSNIPSATGARRPAILGKISYA